MSSENNINIPPSQDSKDENQTSGGRKASSTKPQEQQPLKCPRCDSPNTKFCYYNNYSLSQPRHFCKTCRRYWTKGGALRNVPIGGGCRKSSKKVMKSAASSRFSGGDDHSSSPSSHELSGLKFFQGFSPPAMDFQLGGMSLPRLQQQPSIGGVYSQSSSCFNLDASGSSVSLMGFNNMNSLGGHQSTVQDIGSMSAHTNIASSIESLSCMNQDLHWKLQQQRLALFCAGENSLKESIPPSPCFPSESQTQKPQALFFQNLDISGQQACGVGNSSRKEDSSMATEWFFGNSAVNIQNPTSSGGNNTSTTEWNGIQAWGDLNQYSGLP